MVYVTGDMHGDYRVFSERKLDRLKKGDKLIVTGDFGFIWNNSDEEIKTLARLAKKKYDILFIEGAHENFERLRSFPEADLYLGKAYKIARNIYCLKRGEIYYIDGHSVLAIGGGRPPYDGASPETPSTPTDDELQYAVENIQKRHRRIDLIVTHEAPASVKRLIDRGAEVNDLNIFLDTVMHNTAYRRWFFGSLHQDRQITDRLTCVFEAVHRVE